MRKNTKKKIAPVVVAIIAAAVLVPFLAVLLLGMDALRSAGRPVLAFMGVYALAVAAVLFGVLAAMRARLREIDAGEEEEAKKY